MGKSGKQGWQAWSSPHVSDAQKGKGKGKDDTFPGHCRHCGQWGHKLIHCSLKDQEMKGKGKGKGKGKDGFETYQKGKNYYDQYPKIGKGKGGVYAMSWEQEGMLSLCSMTIGKPISTPVSTHNCFDALREDDTELDVPEAEMVMTSPCLAKPLIGTWEPLSQEEEVQRCQKHTNPINGLFLEPVQLNQISQEPRWVKLDVVVDSGAAESVAPTSMAPWVPVSPSEGSKNGIAYTSASGDKLQNQGEQTVEVLTEEGVAGKATFQIVDVNRALCSVAKMCDKGNTVVFDADGGYVQNAQGHISYFRRENNVYVMSIYTLEPGTAGNQQCEEARQGFHRRSFR